MGTISTFIDEVRGSCRGKSPWARLALLAVMGYFGFKYCVDPEYSSLISALNLGIHEFGHLIFSPLGMTWGIAGGSLTQTLAPFYGFYNFVKQDDYFAATLAFGWLSTSLFETARYAADARAMAMPLVSPFGGDPIHDWNYLLTKWQLLPYDGVVGGAIRGLAVVSMLICIGAGLWMCWEMIRFKE